MIKRILLSVVALGMVAAAIAFSGGQKAGVGGLQIDVDKRNPWTHLRLNDAGETFHFVVVSDRTGGHRARIFSEAVEQINLLQPAFVISVGDLIEGYTKDAAALRDQWKEFQTYTSRFSMPFFYVPGNHDLANPAQTAVWQERFGRRYYHFLYKDVLFLAACSDDPCEDKEEARMSRDQIEYFQKVLGENKNVRWTIVCVHKPMWTDKNLESNGWLDLEKALVGRPYTVFAGHIHKYQKFVRQGMNYYQLATTGGASKVRGLRYGEFDHIVWATMGKQGGPVLANLMLDGIYPEDMKRTVSAEEGHPMYNRKTVQPARGVVTMAGAPVANAYVTFHTVSAADGKTMTRTGDAFAEADGTFTMSTYQAFDGAPAGTYAVTVVLREPFFEPSGKLGANRLPPVFASPKTTPLRVEVKTGANEFALNLTQ